MVNCGHRMVIVKLNPQRPNGNMGYANGFGFIANSESGRQLDRRGGQHEMVAQDYRRIRGKRKIQILCFISYESCIYPINIS